MERLLYRYFIRGQSLLYECDLERGRRTSIESCSYMSCQLAEPAHGRALAGRRRFRDPDLLVVNIGIDVQISGRASPWLPIRMISRDSSTRRTSRDIY